MKLLYLVSLANLAAALLLGAKRAFGVKIGRSQGISGQCKTTSRRLRLLSKTMTATTSHIGKGKVARE